MKLTAAWRPAVAPVVALVVASLALAACDDAGGDPAGADGSEQADTTGSDATAGESDGSTSTDVAGTDVAASDTAASDAVEGDTAEGDADDDAAPIHVECMPDRSAASVWGEARYDADDSDRSAYLWSVTGDDGPAAGRELELIGADGTQTAQACDDGWFGFADVEPGTYVVAPVRQPGELCSTRNCPRRFPEAARSGAVRIVTLGDSIPVVGADVMFPARLATLIEPLAAVENVNIAVAGTTSADWLPNKALFKYTLTPEIGGTDVFIVSVGGNDIVNYANNPAILNDLDAAKAGAVDLIGIIVKNLMTTAAAIREINPDADILYCLYPNYGQAVSTFPWGAVNALLGDDFLPKVLGIARDVVPIETQIVLVDLFGAAEGLPLDDYLVDPLHFNDLGQTLYAEEVFKTLGGVWLQDESPLFSGIAPLGLDKTFGLAAH